MFCVHRYPVSALSGLSACIIESVNDLSPTLSQSHSPLAFFYAPSDSLSLSLSLSCIPLHPHLAFASPSFPSPFHPFVCISVHYLVCPCYCLLHMPHLSLILLQAIETVIVQIFYNVHVSNTDKSESLLKVSHMGITRSH